MQGNKHYDRSPRDYDQLVHTGSLNRAFAVDLQENLDSLMFRDAQKGLRCQVHQHSLIGIFAGTLLQRKHFLQWGSVVQFKSAGRLWIALIPVDWIVPEGGFIGGQVVTGRTVWKLQHVFMQCSEYSKWIFYVILSLLLDSDHLHCFKVYYIL